MNSQSLHSVVWDLIFNHLLHHIRIAHTKTYASLIQNATFLSLIAQCTAGDVLIELCLTGFQGGTSNGVSRANFGLFVKLSAIYRVSGLTDTN